MNDFSGLHHIQANQTGNRIGHDPRQPRLSPKKPIRKGKGGLPRILSLAAEKAKIWYNHPGQCPPLQSNSSRQTRSERREAHQIVLECVLSHLELTTMALGTPTLSGGFIDISMQTMVRDTGIGQRRCERVIRDLKQAGFMEVKQPRKVNAEGRYAGLRAIRVITSSLFEWLGLGPMLARERKRALERLKLRALRANRQLQDFIRRIVQKRAPLFAGKSVLPTDNRGERERKRKRWHEVWRDFIRAGLDIEAAQRQTNRLLGYPENVSPGML